jgi:hypothetical protein
MFTYWDRLENQFDEVEARRSRPEPHREPFCQDQSDLWPPSPWRDQSFSNGGCFPLPTISLDASWREVGSSINPTPELNRK